MSARMDFMEHIKQWEFLKNKFEAGQLAHAYVLAGSDETALRDFAKKFIALIQKKDAKESELPVDLLVVRSSQSESSQKNEKDMMEIDVDQIRALNTFLSYKSYYGGCKAVIIENAERMNVEAQSSLLKTLEEPKGQTVIFLTSCQPDRLMSTIFSRCQMVKFLKNKPREDSPEEEKMLADFLKVREGDLAEKFQYVKKIDFETRTLGSILETAERYFRKLLLMRLQVMPASVVGSGLKKDHQMSLEKIKKTLQMIDRLRYQAMMSNASPKLALEILLLEL